MAGNRNFDRELRLKKGSAQYHLDKMKAGSCGSSAGKPRPYARLNILKARLYSPKAIGQSITVTPKSSFAGFLVGKYYEWEVTDAGVGHIGKVTLRADEIFEHFIVKSKKK